MALGEGIDRSKEHWNWLMLDCDHSAQGLGENSAVEILSSYPVHLRVREEESDYPYHGEVDAAKGWNCNSIFSGNLGKQSVPTAVAIAVLLLQNDEARNGFDIKPSIQFFLGFQVRKRNRHPRHTIVAVVLKASMSSSEETTSNSDPLDRS
ncbi:hypothetical protein U1Q18_012759 [Sarracenia purpurea var. burkii]